MMIRVLLLAGHEVANCIESLLNASGMTFQVERASQLDDAEIDQCDVLVGEISSLESPVFKAIATFAEIAQQKPVVVVSKINDASIARQAIRNGIQDYLPLEQIDHRQLGRALLFALDRHERLRTLSAREQLRSDQLHDCIPTWDQDKRELRVGTVVVKKFHKPSPNQELILAAFEEQQWEHRIFDPIPFHPEICPAERLRATIRSLNSRHESPLIRFHGDGSGQAITWEFIADLPEAGRAVRHDRCESEEVADSH